MTPRGYGRTVARRSSLRIPGRCKPDWTTPRRHARGPQIPKRCAASVACLARGKYAMKRLIFGRSGRVAGRSILARDTWAPTRRIRRRRGRSPSNQTHGRKDVPRPVRLFAVGRSATIEGRSKNRESDSFLTRKRRGFASPSTTVSRGCASNLAPSCSSARACDDAPELRQARGERRRGPELLLGSRRATPEKLRQARGERRGPELLLRLRER